MACTSCGSSNCSGCRITSKTELVEADGNMKLQVTLCGVAAGTEVVSFCLPLVAPVVPGPAAQGGTTAGFAGDDLKVQLDAMDPTGEPINWSTFSLKPSDVTLPDGNPIPNPDSEGCIIIPAVSVSTALNDFMFDWCVEGSSGSVSNTVCEKFQITQGEPPVANDSEFQTLINSPIQIEKASLGIDPDGNIQGIILKGDQVNGTVVDDAGGGCTVTPDPDFIGVITFTYCVVDNDGNQSDPATITVTVLETLPNVFYDENDPAEESVADQIKAGFADPDNFDGLFLPDAAGQLTVPVTTFAELEAWGEANVPVARIDPETCNLTFADGSQLNLPVCFAEPCRITLGEPALDKNTGRWSIPYEGEIGEKNIVSISAETIRMCEIDQSQRDWFDNPQTVITHAGGDRLAGGLVTDRTDLSRLTGSLAGHITWGATGIFIDKRDWAIQEQCYVNETPIAGLNPFPNTLDYSQWLQDNPTSQVRPQDFASNGMKDIEFKLCGQAVILPARNDISMDNSYNDSPFEILGPNNPNPVGEVPIYPVGGIAELNDANNTVSAVPGPPFGLTFQSSYIAHGTLETIGSVNCENHSAVDTGPTTAGNNYTPNTDGFFGNRIAGSFANLVNSNNLNGTSPVTFGSGVVGTDLIDREQSFGVTRGSCVRMQSGFLMRNPNGNGDFIRYVGRVIDGY